MMFWKAVVVAVWAGFTEWWASQKRKEAEQGLAFRQGDDGVFRAHSRLLRIETIARRVFWTACTVLFGYGVFVVWVISRGSA